MKHTIKRTAYQGYLWYSDEQIPKVFDNEEVELELDDTANPFIVEGQLYEYDRRPLHQYQVHRRKVYHKHIFGQDETVQRRFW